MYFVFIGVFFVTAFLDFDVQETNLKLVSHIASIQKFLDTPLGNSSAFVLFSLYMIALIQIINAVGFSQKRSPFSLFSLTLLTLVHTALAILYAAIFFIEETIRDDYVINAAARLSYSVMLAGAVCFIIATIFAWFYVDWSYVKEKE